jgi:hypothetical protein
LAVSICNFVDILQPLSSEMWNSVCRNSAGGRVRSHAQNRQKSLVSHQREL